jgi:hypothetical protein
MRKRFEQQLKVGQILISQIEVNPKYRSAFPKLVLSLKKLYLTPKYNERIFSILEDKIVRGKKKQVVQEWIYGFCS